VTPVPKEILVTRVNLKAEQKPEKNRPVRKALRGMDGKPVIRYPARRKKKSRPQAMAKAPIQVLVEKTPAALEANWKVHLKILMAQFWKSGKLF